MNCKRCGHPQDWHRLDDSKNIPPTDPNAKFRCIGYDCEAPGKAPRINVCQCPDFVEPATKCKHCSEEIKRDGKLGWLDCESFSVCRGTNRKHEPQPEPAKEGKS